MGCGDSKVMTVETRNDLAKLQLSSSQIDTFLAAFHKIDRNNSGFINIKEFIDTLKIERTIASEEVFEDMDFTHDGRISFREFTLLIWRFCTRGLESIAEFAFDIYDTDNSQELTQDEIKEMILETHGKLTDKHNVNMYIHAFDKDGDMKITRNEFCKTVRKMPNILQPALHFQSILRKFVGDEDFWDKLMKTADDVYQRKEVKVLFKTKPRNIKTIHKTRKRYIDAENSKEVKSVDKADHNHTKVNAYYYKEHHEKHEKQKEADKKAGKTDTFSLEY